MRPARRRWTIAVVWFLALAAAVEVASGLALLFLARHGVAYEPLAVDRLSAEHRTALEDLLGGRPSLFQLDEILGWTLRPGFHSEIATVDADGLRRDPARPPANPDAIRVALFGDSFTFGGDVADRFAYPEVLARLAPTLEISNFGVPAYGLDQAFLRYQIQRPPVPPSARRGRAGIVVIGFMSENIFRSLSVFRPFYQPATQVPLAKPRYELIRGELALIANPLPGPEHYRRLLAHPADVLADLGRRDLYFRTKPHSSTLDRSAAVRLAKLARYRLAPIRAVVRRDGSYNVDGEGFQLVAALLQTFHDRVIADGGRPVIVLYPRSQDLATWRTLHTKHYTPLLEFLSAKGDRVVDAMDALDVAAERPVAELIPAHFSPLANQLVAEHLLRKLGEFGLLD
jgi:hypothetical protein